jgi:hypothetical protein
VKHHLLLAAVLTMSAIAQPIPPGQGIERTMSRLEAGETVRILIYGQSISKQNWWRIVADDLCKRYPKADLKIENRAIGGYSTQYLSRTMEADILPFHPDLIVFHDYGSQDLYEKIIRWICSHTTAEILLQSDHVVWVPGEEDPTGARLKSYDSQEKHSFEWLPELAQKYGLGLVDIRGGWHEHLKRTGMKPKDFLTDSVHLNAQGEALYASITKRHLAPGPSPARRSYIEIEPKWKNGRIELDFEGNRVELAGLTDGPVDVWIDGQRPSAVPALHFHSRPTNTWDADWPTVMRVGSLKPLQTEEWILKVTRRNQPGTEFDFEVYGSRTGFDGKGSTRERFVSISQRVTLDPEDYDVARSYGLHKIAMPGDWQVRWASLPRYIDPVLPSPAPQTILYGLPNTKHHLTLVAPKGSNSRLKIRTYQPPLKEN